MIDTPAPSPYKTGDRVTIGDDETVWTVRIVGGPIHGRRIVALTRVEGTTNVLTMAAVRDENEVPA